MVARHMLTAPPRAISRPPEHAERAIAPVEVALFDFGTGRTLGGPRRANAGRALVALARTPQTFPPAGDRARGSLRFIQRDGSLFSATWLALLRRRRAPFGASLVLLIRQGRLRRQEERQKTPREF